MKHVTLKAAALSAAFVVASSSFALADYRYPNKAWGKGTPAERCIVCHSIEKNGPHRSAPNLYGIVGAKKARHGSWFGYSPAIFAKGGDWTEKELDAYLENPLAVAPGTKKSIHVADPAERKKIIDYLKELASK